ncbi:protein of unknown function [Petrocella atlantisensis]|uniref:Uncharacterized protein n=1 Tax=Petrocella atlantisensis TaxID=2173034 RepID=A0A3P7NY11_9FIRM|nr:protein of unknown function [Petrocella atlantisensis]
MGNYSSTEARQDFIVFAGTGMTFIELGEKYEYRIYRKISAKSSIRSWL